VNLRWFTNRLKPSWFRSEQCDGGFREYALARPSAMWARLPYMDGSRVGIRQPCVQSRDGTARSLRSEFLIDRMPLPIARMLSKQQLVVIDHSPLDVDER
jgi:hypothetical protein